MVRGRCSELLYPCGDTQICSQLTILPAPPGNTDQASLALEPRLPLCAQSIEEKGPQSESNQHKKYPIMAVLYPRIVASGSANPPAKGA